MNCDLNNNIFCDVYDNSKFNLDITNLNDSDLIYSDLEFDTHINEFYNTITYDTKYKNEHKNSICKEHKRFRYSCKDCYDFSMKNGYKSAYCEHLKPKSKCPICKNIIKIRKYNKKNKN